MQTKSIPTGGNSKCERTIEDHGKVEASLIRMKSTKAARLTGATSNLLRAEGKEGMRVLTNAMNKD